MESLLRRYLGLVDISVVALCAALCGRAAADVVAMWDVTPHIRLSRPPPLPAGSTPSFGKPPDNIIARNLFCSDCPPLLVDEATPVSTEGPSTLPLVLLAVMYAEPTRLGNRSIAVLKDEDSREIGAFVLGDRVYGATLTDIWPTRVYLDRAEMSEYLDLLEAPAPRVPTACTADPPKPKGAIATAIERGIKRLGEHRFEVQRRTLASVLENVGMLSRWVRPVPEIKDGRMAGFRLFAVHPDGPVAKIGMQNGDVISSIRMGTLRGFPCPPATLRCRQSRQAPHAINDLEITSPDKVIEAFGKLRSASHLSLQLERGGQRITNDYVIR